MIKYLRSNFLEQLKRDISNNLDSYSSDDSWLDEYAAHKQYALDTRLELPDGFALFTRSEDGGRRDIENVRLLYDALRDLSPVQASDARLWTYLSHVTFWKYMRARWDVESKPNDQRPGYILSHYFVNTGSSRSLIRNGIASLWWYGYLTYDSQRNNPYELTNVLLKKLDVARNILERNLGRNRTLLHAFLDFLIEHPEIESAGNAGRELIRSLVRRINFYGGVCILDTLGHRELSALFNEHLESLA